MFSHAIWHEGTRHPDATGVDLSRLYDRRVLPEPAAPAAQEPDRSVNLLELADRKQEAKWAQAEISYAKAEDGEGR